MLAFENLLEAPHGVADGHVAALLSSEGFSHEHGLGEETLNLASASYGQPILVGQLLDSQDRDDVLKVTITLEHLATS